MPINETLSIIGAPIVAILVAVATVTLEQQAMNLRYPGSALGALSEVPGQAREA